MKKFTIDDLRAWRPCYDPTRYLPADWSGTALDILDVKNCDFSDRLWVILRTDLVSEKFMRLFAVWCARQVQHLMKDERSIYALDFMDAYCEWYWEIDDQDWRDGWVAARVAAWAAAGDAAGAAAWDAARDAAWAAAEAAARDAARAAAEAAAGAAAWDAARDAARAAQENQLRKMLIAGVETGDVK